MERGNYEMGDGMQQCIDHSHRNNNPGAICAFCLQDKLGKLLSSSTSSFPSPSSSSPSFTPPSSSDHNTRSRLPFLVPNKKPSSDNIIFKRSKSTATPRKRNGFWSFLYPSSSKEAKSFGPNVKPRDKCVAKQSDHVIIITEEDKCCFSSSKVSRSRSVGCGSRSFSADFFERISSGLGDCTLRRVESQRASASVNHCMKERVRCGGIFGGFVMTSSSSSTASSWVDDGSRGRSWGWAFASPMRAFTNNKASSSSSSSSAKRDASDHKNATPNLSAIPSLLTVRG